MSVFPASCPHPRINKPRIRHEPREQALFGDICELNQPRAILEIGSWMGGSAIAWAQHATKYHGDAKIYCVDTWLGSVEHYLSTCGAEWSIERLSVGEYGPSFFDDFLYNIHANGYAHHILPFRADSSSALPFFASKGMQFDVVYIDGAHDAISVCRDVTNSLAVLSKDGMICGDDFGWLTVRDGLLLARLMHGNKLRVYFKNSDFIVFAEIQPHREEEAIKKGYSRWKPGLARLLRQALSFPKRVLSASIC